jgi:rfaE bifunctional protein nucleotidyltransferase chain/domain/rfaE bifunctional protein kinase chain/domain
MRTRERRVVVVGDVLLDRDVVGRAERLCPDAPAPVVDVDTVSSGPGGAGLAAVICARHGARVTLVAPVAADAYGAELLELLAAEGVNVVALDHAGPTRCKTRVRAGDYSLARFDEGGPGTPGGQIPADALDLIATADAVLVSDYGAGTCEHPGLRAALGRRAREDRIVVWDPHPRGGPPVTGVTLVTPNLGEARGATAAHCSSWDGGELAAALHRQWEVSAVCVTAGAQGAWLATTSPEPYFAPAPSVTGGDPCGAGDCLAATAAVALAAGATPPEAVSQAVQEASRWVDSGGTAGFRTRTSPPRPHHRWAAHSRADGVVVATGGCFDVLHAGHVASLEAARRLGDSLVVLLNSDESVRRLKGPGRPVQPVEDRARLLRALSVVDDVVVFDEDDPREALRRVRPDIWAKGGDYDANSLPEAEVVRSWGGRVVLLPYLSGRSTTSLLRRHQERNIHDNVS